MSVLKEHKATLISIAVSLFAFCVCVAAIMFYEAVEQDRLIAEEHLVIQALFAEEQVLVYEQTIDMTGPAQLSSIDLARALNMEFASMQCIEQGTRPNVTLDNASLVAGNIMLYSDEWVTEVSTVDRFRETLFAEGYFGLVRVSRPCYNLQRDKAVIYFERDCGPACGNSEVVLLALENGAWRRLAQRIVLSE